MININPEDLQLKLLSKKPIYVDKVPIYPIPLDTISDIGYTRFNQFLRIFCVGKDEISKTLEKEVLETDIYNLIIWSILSDKYVCKNCKYEYSPIELNLTDFNHCPKCHSDNIGNFTLDLFIEWLSIACRQDVTFSYERCTFVLDKDEQNRIVEINSSNFLDVQTVLRKRNGIEESKSIDEENPADEKAKALLQRQKEVREKLKKSKSNSEDDEGLTLGDLVSILAGGMKLPLFTVMEYDMYQFNDQFNRLRIFDDYQVNIQALLHGAKSEELNIQHWLSKIKKPDED